MKRTELGGLSVDELVEQFTEIGIAQSEALLGDEIERFNRLFRELRRVNAELKRRPGDARRVLTRLYGHRNIHVWLNAAKETLAIAPEEARRQLHAIKDSRRFPQAGDAGMALWTLDEGIYRPT